MKLLLDENLSPRLVPLLANQYPGSTQVDLLGLRGTTDTIVWEMAKSEGYIIVSKDNDFRQRSFQYGAPPKVIWLKVGNAGTTAIAQLLAQSRTLIERFVTDPDSALLVLSLLRQD